MKAGIASPNGIAIQDVPEPTPGPADLLVKVKAIGLNRADLGAAKAATSDGGKPIGIEFAGEVIATGSAVEGFRHRRPHHVPRDRQSRANLRCAITDAPSKSRTA